MNRVKQRLHEQETGRYNFKEMYEAVTKGQLALDAATYTGPVMVKASPGRGRGLFSTKDVKAGELLLCEKAVVFSPVAPSHDNIGVLMNLSSGDVTIGTQPDVIASLVQKIFRNPSLKPAVSDLYCGSYEPSSEPSSVDGQPVIDS
jgi:hypothetical protein